MKITEIQAIPLAVPLQQVGPPSSWAGGAGKQILVRAATDDGLVGWGECFAYGATEAVCHVVDDALAPIVRGQDPTQIESLVDRMHRALMIWGRRGLAMMAVSGVELALWDLAGKARNVPVYELLGGLCQSRLRVYASLLRYDTPSQVGQAVTGALALGHRAVKLHQTDVESVVVAREVAGGDVDIMLDTNCPVVGRGGDSDRPAARTIRSALAGGTGLAAGRLRRPRACTRRAAHPDRGRRERCDRLRVPRAHRATARRTSCSRA